MNNSKFSAFAAFAILLTGLASGYAVITSNGLAQAQTYQTANGVQPRQVALVDFPIQEMGITLKVPQQYATDLKYNVKKEGNDVVASFSSQSLMMAGGQHCIVEEAPLGSIYQVPYGLSSGNGLPSDKKHLGQSWIYFLPPQATCSDDKSVQTLQGVQIDVVRTATLRADFTQVPGSTKVYFPLPELGIKIQVPRNLANDLLYEVKDSSDSHQGKSVFFTTHSLIAASAGVGESFCSLEYAPLGGYDVYSTTTDVSATLPQDFVHLPGYDVGFFPPQATCSDDQSVRSLQSKQIESLRAAVYTTQLL